MSSPAAFVSINPATGRRIEKYATHTRPQLSASLDRAMKTFRTAREIPFRERARSLRRVARWLRNEKETVAALVTAEVGKPIAQARAEIEKSALACDYCADHGGNALAPEHPIAAPANAEVRFDPLGVVLAIMPWNFPIWQAIRAAAPALAAGNTVLLKPAPTTAGCSLFLAELFRRAGFETGALQVILADTNAVAALIADPRVAGVTLTGSTRAGKHVAALAGAALKPVVLELGGSDAYLILDDADPELAATCCAQSRLVNSGQSCVAAKRFIVTPRVRREFERRFVERMAAAVVGDPTRPETEVGPLARADLRDQLHQQVQRSLLRGARALLAGGPMPGPGFFYAPSVLTNIEPGMPAADEELFGPVGSIIAVRDETAAVAMANRSAYGLGAAIFTCDRRRARRLATQIEAGCVAINDFVRSDPALPFGGVKQSGLGRELGAWGFRSFVNVKTVSG